MARRAEAVLGTQRFSAAVRELEAGFNAKLREFIAGRTSIWLLPATLQRISPLYKMRNLFSCREEAGVGRRGWQ